MQLNILLPLVNQTPQGVKQLKLFWFVHITRYKGEISLTEWLMVAATSATVVTFLQFPVVLSAVQ